MQDKRAKYLLMMDTIKQVSVITAKFQFILNRGWIGKFTILLELFDNKIPEVLLVVFQSNVLLHRFEKVPINFNSLQSFWPHILPSFLVKCKVITKKQTCFSWGRNTFYEKIAISWNDIHFLHHWLPPQWRNVASKKPPCSGGSRKKSNNVNNWIFNLIEKKIQQHYN